MENMVFASGLNDLGRERPLHRRVHIKIRRWDQVTDGE